MRKSKKPSMKWNSSSLLKSLKPWLNPMVDSVATRALQKVASENPGFLCAELYIATEALMSKSGQVDMEQFERVVMLVAMEAERREVVAGSHDIQG